MKRTHLSLLALSSLLLLFGSCSSDKKHAEQYLESARQAYESGDLEKSQSLLDSIKVLYPKQYDVRHRANDLSYEVEKSVQNRNIEYLNTSLEELEARIQEAKKPLALDKNEEYQSQGHYMAPSQLTDKNGTRSYLRFQVREDGQMSVTSIYTGASNIHHTMVKVSSADGSYAQTPDGKDIYESENLGRKTEKADFKLGEDGGVIQFCASNSHLKSLTLEFLGDRSFKTTLSSQDLKAAKDCLELSHLLFQQAQMTSQIQEAQTKIQFIDKLSAQKASREESKE